jgi:hypothetical protein
MQPMRRFGMHSWGVQCFFFVGWGVSGSNFLFFFLPLFWICFHHVHMGFPKLFPIAPQFYPIWFAQSSTPMCINWKGGPEGKTFVSVLGLGVQRGAAMGECPNAPKELVMGQSMLFPSKRKKVWGAHEPN